MIGETVENTAPTPILHEEFAPAIKDVEVRPVFEGARPEPQSRLGLTHTWHRWPCGTLVVKQRDRHLK